MIHDEVIMNNSWNELRRQLVILGGNYAKVRTYVDRKR